MSDFDFMQIGKHAIRLDKIACIYFGPNMDGRSRVWIHFAGDTEADELILSDEAAETFKKWWDGGHVNLWVIRDTIAGKFAEALGNIECAIAYLGQINEQYEEHADLDPPYGLRPASPAERFWTETDKAEVELQDVFRRLQRVGALAPKEVPA